MKNIPRITNETLREGNHRPSSGWYHTDKFGDVFVSPDGTAWGVQQSGARLVNVAVNLNSADITKTSLLERRKQSIAKQSYRRGRIRGHQRLVCH